jgi:hypothetical protein
MSTITYRIIMALLLANIGIGVYAAVTYMNPPKTCIMGIVMQPKGDMMVQSGLLPVYCMPISRD